MCYACLLYTSAFEKLYHRYSGKLYNFIMRISAGNRYMAEEVVQSTFIRIWEVRGTVDPESSFISFLCTIAKNLLMNMYQRQTVESVSYTHLVLDRGGIAIYIAGFVCVECAE